MIRPPPGSCPQFAGTPPPFGPPTRDARLAPSFLPPLTPRAGLHGRVRAHCRATSVPLTPAVLSVRTPSPFHSVLRGAPKTFSQAAEYPPAVLATAEDEAESCSAGT